MTSNQRPKFVMVVQPLPHADPIRALKTTLKRMLRDDRLRCLDIREELSTCQPTESLMEKSDLEHLRSYAAAARTRGGFGVPFLKKDGNDGYWIAGKDKTGARRHARLPEIRK